MAKGAYIGVNGVAKKVKSGYIGVTTNVAIYDETVGDTTITATNITEFFTVTNGSSYYFNGSGGTFTSNNHSDSTSAMSTWTALVDMSKISFNYSVSSESNYDKLTIKVGDTTVANGISGSSSNTWTGSLTKGQSIQLTYSKDGSQSSGSDTGTISNIVITCAKKTLIGTEVRNLARKIKKAYVGIGGVARPCWAGGGKPTYYGTITGLNAGKTVVSANVGEYAIFAAKGNDNVANAYNKKLIRSTFGLSTVTVDSAASVGNYALFHLSGNARMYTVDRSLTVGEAPAPSNSARYKGATSIANHALFGGGYSAVPQTAVDAYDTSLTRKSLSAMTNGNQHISATSIPGHYAFFHAISYVTAYDTSLVKHTAPNSTEVNDNMGTSALRDRGAAHVGDYALFAGGWTHYWWDYDNDDYTSSSKTIVDAYNTSLTKSAATPLSVTADSMGSVTFEDYAIFAGGIHSDSYYFRNDVHVYDKNLTMSIGTPISVARRNVSGAVVGDYALFAGGSIHGGSSDTVDAYILA